MRSILQFIMAFIFISQAYANIKEELFNFIGQGREWCIEGACVITVISSWCPYCHKEYYWLCELKKQYPNLPIFAILYKDKASNLDVLYAGRQNIFQEVISGFTAEAIRETLNISTIPRTYIIYKSELILQLSSSINSSSYNGLIMPTLRAKMQN